MKQILTIVFILSSIYAFAQDTFYILDGDTVIVANNNISLPKEKLATILDVAQQHLGVSYKYGGKDYNGMDCSGLICKAFQSVNIDLPRSSSAIAQQGKYIAADYLQAGDLIFFKGRNSTSIGHVAMVSKILDGAIYILHATTSRGVIEEKLTSNTYFMKRWLYNKRIIN